MMFDKLCGIAERKLPNLIPLLKQAKIFKFEGVPHEVLQALFVDRTNEDITDIFHSFYLPFRAVAIEDGGSCIVMADLYDEQIGLDTDRIFIELLSMNSSDKYFNDEGRYYKDKQKALEALGSDDYHMVSIGRAKIVQITKGEDSIVAATNIDKYKTTYVDNRDKNRANNFGLVIDGTLNRIFAGNKDKLVEYDNRTVIDSLSVEQHVLKNILVAYEELLYFQNPNKFILRTANVGATKRAKKRNKNRPDRIPRSPDKPIYTILRPDEIRERMGIQNFTDGVSHEQRRHITMPFERRRHWRYLSHEKFRYSKDGKPVEPKVIPTGQRRGEYYYKRVDVPATWVGTSERIIGNKHYKVILNR